MNRKMNLPIIHIIGLPGAGKTTLAAKLSKRFNHPVYGIDEYRAKFPSSVTGETDAWLALFRALSKKKWSNCILETTGLNCREKFLRAALPFPRIVTIKLEAKRKVLYERIEKKDIRGPGKEWLFSKDFRDKKEFVRKMFKDFKDAPAQIRINTSKSNPHEVYGVALSMLERFYFEMID